MRRSSRFSTGSSNRVCQATGACTLYIEIERQKDWLGNGIKEPEASGGKSRTQKRRRSNQRRNHHGNALLDAESSGIYGDVAIKRSSTWRRLLRPRSTRNLVCPADISWIKRAFVFRLNADWPIYGITQGFHGCWKSFVRKEMNPVRLIEHIVKGSIV